MLYFPLKMKLLACSIVSWRRFHWTEGSLGHMYSYVLVQQSSTGKGACAIATSERPFINMCLHVCTVL